ncbi:MAG: hypothetical protein HOH74_10335 [Gemmatimonadetes bacterium]|nr:hypothetical protein [Gemmatimonadota bacterium]
MRLLFLFVYRQDLLDEALEALVEMEINDATVIEGTPMERILADDVPIFAGLWQSHGEAEGHTRLIMATVNEQTLHDLIALLGDVGVDLSNPKMARLLTLPVECHTSAGN